ncbi:transcriptional regulator HtpK [Bacillus inaquosorum]|uniref:transcriptional regulator HtpK n=1 Tax=Bacillus inaquosorum TaxID=483913 RepID=UPI00227F8884|nr:transcriptional regulator HtpK [Bacillus inaquosorum]MCY8787574.1 transcriptional regulator HtpK [Bacillus inaquosorum]
MNIFKLTRTDMVRLLYSLKGQGEISPLDILVQSANMSADNAANHLEIPEFLTRYERKKQKKEYGLSTNEIVELGNLCELTSLKSTAIQNWVKRDIKDLIGHPELGKKYSVEQAVILLIVRDLKSIYDFEHIRAILKVAFNTISDRSDDVISPIDYYESCAYVLDAIYHQDTPSMKESNLQEIVEQETSRLRHRFEELNDSQWLKIRQIIAITVLSILTFHIQATAHKMTADIL